MANYQNSGTLITAAIRPNSSLDKIATTYANEGKGGLHTVLDEAGRNAIITARREWGMLCSISTSDVLYKLVEGFSSGDITDNGNWKLYAPKLTDATSWHNGGDAYPTGVIGLPAGLAPYFTGAGDLGLIVGNGNLGIRVLKALLITSMEVLLQSVNDATLRSLNSDAAIQGKRVILTAYDGDVIVPNLPALAYNDVVFGLCISATGQVGKYDFSDHDKSYKIALKIAAGSSLIGTNVYQNNALIGAFNVTDILVNKVAETEIDGDFVFDSGTGTITRVNPFFEDDSMIISYSL